MRLVLIAIALVALEVIAFAGPTPTAEDLYDEGRTSYNKADYPTAITKWWGSYELSRESGLLFNLAQAYRLGGDCANALSTYKRFIAVDPTADQRELADDLVRELEPKCGARPPPIKLRPPSVATPVAGERERERPGRTLKVAGLVTGGAGAASIALGIALGHHASSLADEVTRTCAVSCDWSMQKSKHEAGHRDATIGYALDTVGIVAIVGGATMYYLGNRDGSLSISPRTREGGAVVTWSGSW